MISHDILSTEEKTKDEPFPTSNLATLFDKEKSISTSSTKDISLAYKAPKQPKSFFNQDPKKSINTVVFCAKTVKIANNVENRLGIALIGNENVHAYELILYKDKQNVSHRIKVNSAFIFNIDQKKSASFNDDSGDLLRVEFQTERDFHEFTEWIKRKRGQIVQETKKEIKSDLVRDNEFSFKPKDGVEKSLTNETSQITSNTSANVDNSSPSAVEMIISDHKLVPKVRRRLNNEPFNYLCTPNTTNPTQNNIPYHDINYSTITHCNTFMADNLNSFMAENRSQSCEMRMHMLQLSSKLDTLLRDVNNISKTQNTTDSLHQTERELKQENDDVRKRLHDCELNIEALEEQNCKLKCDLQNKLAIIDSLTLDLSEFKVKCQESDSMNNVFKNEIDDLSDTIKNQQLELEQCEINVRKRLSDELEVNLDSYVKESMNKLYMNILDGFDEETAYEVRQIEQSIAGNLRNTTHELVQTIIKSALEKI